MSEHPYNGFKQLTEIVDGVIAIDYFFAKEMHDALPKTAHQQTLFHLFLALSASLRAGHSCLALNQIAEQSWGKTSIKDFSSNSLNVEKPGYLLPNLSQLQQMLASLAINKADNQLLVVTDTRLYLRRYFQFESDLQQAITMRLAQTSKFADNEISACVERLFPANPQEADNEVDWQKIAVANAINKNFSVIAGGPGTGKTYTVTKLLAALVMLDKKSTHSSPLTIALVAPTGKAAQRLSESIVNAVDGFKDLIDSEILNEIPTQAQTIHRLLGVISNSPNFRHDQQNKLAYDVVLIDEVSMVDLPLMTRVFRALKDNAKVILLGDADQLPSVAAGSVLADIAPRPHGGFSESNKNYLANVCQLHSQQNDAIAALQQQAGVGKAQENFDYLTFLVKSRRFDGKGGIGLIAHSVIKGDAANSWQLLQDAKTHGSEQLSLAEGEIARWLKPLVKQYYQPIALCDDINDAFALLGKFRVLCATRQGDFGVEHLNELIKSYLGKNQGLYQQGQQGLYHGQPIMINENDYRLGLYNGDIGIIWQVMDQDGQPHLMACFETTETDAHGAVNTRIKQILPSRLPHFESVYAMTIHKTQGSEFAHVAMVISSTEQVKESKQSKQTGSKLLSRELLYTGITRAKKQLTIACNQQIWQQGVSAQVLRHSGLNLHCGAEK